MIRSIQGFVLIFFVCICTGQQVIRWTGATSMDWGDLANWDCQGPLCNSAPIPPDSGTAAWTIGFPQCASNVEMIISYSVNWPEIEFTGGTCPKVSLHGDLSIARMRTGSFLTAVLRFYGMRSTLRLLLGTLAMRELVVANSLTITAANVEFGTLTLTEDTTSVAFNVGESSSNFIGTITGQAKTDTQVITLRTDQNPTVPFVDMRLLISVSNNGSALLRFDSYANTIDVTGYVIVSGPMSMENTGGVFKYSGPITYTGDHVLQMFPNSVVNNVMNSTTADSSVKFYGSLHFTSTSSVLAVNIKPIDSFPVDNTYNELILDGNFENTTVDWGVDKQLTIRQTLSDHTATLKSMNVKTVLFNSTNIQIDDLTIPSTETVTLIDSSVQAILSDSITSIKLDMQDSTFILHASKAHTTSIEVVKATQTAKVDLNGGFFNLPQDMGHMHRTPVEISVANGTLNQRQNIANISSLILGGTVKFGIYELTDSSVLMSGMYDTYTIQFKDGAIVDIEFPGNFQEPEDPIDVLLISTASRAPLNLPKLVTNLTIVVTTTLERPAEGGVYLRVQKQVSPTTSPPTTEPPTTLPPEPVAPSFNDSYFDNRTSSRITCIDCGNSLSGGAIAGIIIVVLFVVGVAVVGGFIWWKRQSTLSEAAAS